MVSLVTMLPLWSLAVGAPSLVVAGLLTFGPLNMALNTMSDAVLQIVTPAELRGRTFGTVISRRPGDGQHGPPTTPAVSRW